MNKMKNKQATIGPKRAAIYVRVSSENQAKTKGGDGQEAEEKESPQAQERDCRALAERQGYVVVKVYRDTEKYRVGKKMVEPSGTRSDRPGLRAMLADARHGDFEVILAWREDRLYRGYRPMLDVLDCIEETDVDVELAKETFDKTMAPVKAWAARMELQAKHDRVMMGVAGRLRQGKTFVARPPYGYNVIDGRFEIVPSEAEWVQKVWQWFGECVGMSEIRQRLIECDAPQKRGGAKHVWSIRIIQAILRHDYYHTGIFVETWDGETFEIGIPPIVDARTAKRVKDYRARYKTYPAGNLKEQSIAAGLVYCQTCGVKMHLSSYVGPNGKRYVYYICHNQIKHQPLPGCAKTIRLHKLETVIWDKVWSRISDPVKFEAAIRESIAKQKAQEIDAEAECHRLQSKLEDLDFERQRVITGWRKGRITDDELDTQKAALWIEECEIKREIADKQLLVGNRSERLIAVALDCRERLVAGVQVNFDPKTPEEKQALFEWRRKVVQGIVKRVDVLPDKTPDVHIEIDDEQLQGELLPASLCVSNTSSCS